MDQEIRFAKAPDGVRIAYAAVGDGPALVKTAHWLTHLENDWQSPIWRPWLEGMAQERTLIRYDERGCGLSDRDVSSFSLDDWIMDLETAVDAAGLERFPLVGMSQGGAIATAYAVRHPERVSHLILYGAYARGRMMRDPTPREREESETLIKLVELGWGGDDPAFGEVFASLFLPRATEEKRRRFLELQRVSSSAETAAAIIRLFDRIDVSSLAKRVSVPTLVLHVRSDSRVPFEEGRRLASLIPDARLVGLEGRNHILQEGESALREFLAELERFLDDEQPRSHPFGSRSRLTPREREVLDLVARGWDNAGIAERLCISPKTVRNHVSRIYSKLGVRRRAKAVVVAREAGFGRGDFR